MKDISIAMMLGCVLFLTLITNINGYLYDLRHNIIVRTNNLPKDEDCFGYALDFARYNFQFQVFLESIYVATTTNPILLLKESD